MERKKYYLKIGGRKWRVEEGESYYYAGYSNSTKVTYKYIRAEFVHDEIRISCSHYSYENDIGQINVTRYHTPNVLVRKFEWNGIENAIQITNEVLDEILKTRKEITAYSYDWNKISENLNKIGNSENHSLY